MKLGQLPRVLQEKPGTALMVKGGPGVGKTEVVLDYYGSLPDHFVVKFVAAQETPESVTGFLWLNQQTGNCEYLPQRRLKALNDAMKQGKKGVLIIDEYKSGDRMVHNALQQLVREHEVGDWIAAGDMYVVALTNREEDRANVVRLTAPTINRMEQITVEADFGFWRDWASTKGLEKRPGKRFPRIHPDILAWLSAMYVGGAAMKSTEAKEWAKDKALLFCSPAPKTEEAFPTPRSHEIASDVLYKFAGEDDSLIHELLAGCIGEGPAYECMAWRKVGLEAEKHVEGVLAGKSVPSLEIGMQFFVNSSLTAKLAQDPKKVAGPLVKYLAQIESEYAIMLISDTTKVAGKEIQSAPGWMDVVKKHRKVALAGGGAR